MSHAYSIRPTVDGEVFRWVLWDKDDVTPLQRGTAASEDAALQAIRSCAAALVRGEAAPLRTTAPPH